MAAFTLEAELKNVGNGALVTALLGVGFTSLTPVQKECLPLALAGQDVLAKAKTGTGKTMAFLIPCVAKILAAPAPGVSTDAHNVMAAGDPIRVLILSGTRELASQIEAQAEKLSQQLPRGTLTLACVLGGSSITRQKEQLDPGFQAAQRNYGGRVDLLVATPGRLLEHIESTEGFAARLKQVRAQQPY
jgi:superfamily II DNA/RNA helicase